jgi:hypothetical protein
LTRLQTLKRILELLMYSSNLLSQPRSLETFLVLTLL